MSWKKRLPGKSTSDPKHEPLERIRAASKPAQDAPTSKWGAHSNSVLETYAAAEEALRPAAEAGTLAPDIILPNGHHVGGVGFEPYDGAGKAWSARMGLIQDKKWFEGGRSLSSDDLDRIIEHATTNFGSKLLSACEEELRNLEKSMQNSKYLEHHSNVLESFYPIRDWLEKNQQRPELKQVVSEILRETLTYSPVESVEELKFRFFDAASQICYSDRIRRANIGDAPVPMPVLPYDEKFSWDYGKHMFYDALKQTIAKISEEAGKFEAEARSRQ